MKPTKIGQIVKFAEPLSTQEQEQTFEVLEIFLDVEIPRALVRYIEDCTISSTHSYLVSDLELIEDIYAI